MTSQVLKPVPKTDPRPSLLSVEVIGTSYSYDEGDYLTWMMNREIDRDGTSLKDGCISAIQSADQDPYRAAKALQDQFGFPSDYALVKLLDRTVQRLPTVLTAAVLRWVVRINHRFPAKSGDLIVFRDKWRNLRTGRVKSIHHSTASALVDIEFANRSTTVLAEEVRENKSELSHSPETPLTQTNVVKFK